jgi:SAM-dependent methyltransferase
VTTAGGDPDLDRNRRAWDTLADAYHRHVGWPDDELTWGLRCPAEGELRLVSDVVAGARTLVLGCGGGEDLVALAHLGAGPLTGVDLSTAQLDHARRRCADHEVTAELVHGDVADLSGLPTGGYDLVVSVQALDYVADLDRCLREIRRVLRPAGVLALSVLHPADLSTDDAPPHGWHRSWFAGRMGWRWDGLADDAVDLVSWFRSASDWFTACTAAGLVVERLLEPAPVDDPRWLERGWLDATTYAKAELVPSTILVRARRPEA